MEIMIFLFSMGVIFGTIVAGVGVMLHDRQSNDIGLYYNEEQNIFYFKE